MPEQFKNTDRELWRDGSVGGTYSERVFVTEDGGIGLECGSHVVVMPIHDWQILAASRAPDVSLAATPAVEDLKNALQLCEGVKVLFPVGRGMTLPETGVALQELLNDVLAVARLLRAALHKLEAK